MAYRVILLLSQIAISRTAAEGVALSKAASGYGPQIDSLRAIAVFAVLYTHFWNDKSQLAHLGVRLFFVISGYLITAILLNARERVTSSQGIIPTIKAFYARRALRIFPAYYFILIVVLILGVDGIRETAYWHIPYMSNILFALQNSWDPWPTAHLWSLSVEEQFYLVWPFLILLAPKRALLPLLALTIVVAILSRFYLLETAPEGPRLYVLTPVALDALGAGALLATLESMGWMTAKARSVLFVSAILGLLALFLSFSGEIPYGFFYTVGEALFVLPMVALVATAKRGFSGHIGAVLENKYLRYFGRISYGVYLYHFFVLAIIFIVCDKLGWTAPDLGPRRFVVAGFITLVVAMASWHLLEEPLNRQKRHFPYPSDRAEGEADTAEQPEGQVGSRILP